MILRTAYVVLLVFLISACGNAENLPDQTGESLLPVPRFESHGGDEAFPVTVPGSYRSEKGYLIVLEDRSRPTGPTLRLPVVVVKSSAEKSAEGPVLYLAGGPGSGGMSAAAYPGAYPFLRQRDFVVFAQRGTRHAQPALECPEYDEARGQWYPDETTAERVDRLVIAAQACRARLEGSGVDLGAYHTAASAADVEDLRRVLGITQWTLYGVSYGTRLGLAVMRDYPGSVRAAILDSPLPPQARYDDESASNFEAALQLVFRDCEASASCREAFPALRERFYASLARADKDPVVIARQQNSHFIEQKYRGAALAVLVSLDSPEGIAQAPLILDAIARRDTSIISAISAGGSGNSGYAWGMRFSVWCGEALSHSARMTASGPGAVLGGVESAAVPPEVCEAWDVPVRPVAETLPVSSDVPTLIIVGEYDPATPPVWAREAARTLPNSRVVVIPGAGHLPTQTWRGDGCAMDLAALFALDPWSIVTPEAALPPCLSGQGPPDFVTETAVESIE
jgi:pimeloyl-ACP methyl ester carboxylesterase